MATTDEKIILKLVEGEESSQFANWVISVFGAAAAASQSHGKLGLIGHVMTEAAYIAKYVTPFVPMADPGPRPEVFEGNMTFAIWNEERKMYHDYLSDYENLKTKIINSLSPTAAKVLQPDEGWQDMTILEIGNGMYMEFGTLSSGELTQNEALLAVPLGGNERFTSLIVTHKGVHKVQENNGQPMAPVAKYKALKMAIESGPRDVLLPMRLYLASHPTVATQTFSSLEDHFRNYFSNPDPEATTATGGYAAAVVPESTAMANLASIVAAQAQMLDRLLANQVVTSNKRRGGGRETGGGSAGRNTRETAYCWTHGITTNLAHNSATCTKPEQGHQAAATADNKMGGSKAVFQPFHSRK